MDTETITTLHTLLSNKYLLCSVQPSSVHDYYSLKLLVINQELEKEISALIIALDSNPQTFPDYFIMRCQTRARQNADSCLSLFAFPLGDCNQLDTDIAKILFHPQTMSELLHYLEPDITTLILPELNSTSSDDNPENATVRLTECSTRLLMQEPTAKNLADFAVSGRYLFDLKTINRLPLQIHQKLYHELRIDYPDLTQNIYKQHNKDLIALEEHILTIASNGKTPLEVIRGFFRKYLPGDLATENPSFDNSHAPPTHTDPIHYLNSLDSKEKNRLLALTDPDSQRSIYEVISRLHNKGLSINKYDADRLINELQKIIANPDNQDILNQQPLCSAQYLQTFNARYSSQPIIPTANEELDLPLPDHYLKMNFSQLKITKNKDLLRILLLIPAHLYASLIQFANINNKKLFRNRELWELILKGGFNHERLTAFYQALVINVERFGGVRKLLIFAVAVITSFDLFRMLLDTVPPEQRISILNIKDEKAGMNLFHYASLHHLPILQYILGLVHPDNLLDTLFEEDDLNRNVLYNAVKSAQSIKLILQIIPGEYHLAMTRRENSEGEDLLCTVVRYPISIETVLGIYPKSDRIEAATREYKNGSTLLHYAARWSLKSLKMFLQFWPKEEWVSILNKKNHRGETALSHAVACSKVKIAGFILQLIPNPDLLDVLINTKVYDGNIIHKIASLNRLCQILALLHESDHVVAVKQVAKNGKNIFHFARNDPQALQAIWNAYPKEERIAALLKENKRSFYFYSDRAGLFFSIIFHEIVPIHKSLEAFFEVILDSQTRQTLVEATNFLGQNALHIAVTNPKSLEIILNLYPPEYRSKRLNLKDGNGKSALSYAEKYPESMVVIAKLLPELPSELLSLGFFSQAATSSNNTLVTFSPRI